MITVNVDIDVAQQLPVVARPYGEIIEKGSVTTTASYAKVASRTVADGETFQLAKTLVSCDQDVMYKLVWDSTIIGAEVLVKSGIPFTDWYPWDYMDMEGDGSKELEIQVKYPSGGAAGTCHAEIVGEEE